MVLKRDNYLNLVRMKGNGEVYCLVSINGNIYDRNRNLFEQVQNECLHVDVIIDKIPVREKENYQYDIWGCLWHYPGDYLDGQVVKSPLTDWKLLDSYKFPDPDKYTDWQIAEKNIKECREKDVVAGGWVEHGFFFLRLTYLRGYENLMIDIAEDRKELYILIEKLTEFWCEVVKRWVSLGIDEIYFGDDLGTQKSLPISPLAWRKLIKPAYSKIFSLCREKNVEVNLHTDGYIVDIIPDLIDTGVTILNPQDVVNGIDNIERLAKGKVCIKLDIDRQRITVFGKPKDIDTHIFNCIRRLGSPQGGLMLIYGAYPGTPVENIIQVIRSMEKYYNYWKKIGC